MPAGRFEVDDVEGVVTARVNDDGRLWGLKEFAGREVLIIVQARAGRRLPK